MTDSEAHDFITRLIIAFPGVEDIARFNSPDLGATHRVWARTLSVCELSECDGVLDDWIEGRASPPTREDQKMIAVVIRQIVMRQRDRARKKLQEQRRGEEYRQLPGTPYSDRQMKKHFVKLKRHWDAHCDGEMSAAEYAAHKRDVLGRVT